MKRTFQFLILSLIAAALFAAPSIQWKPGGGIQTRLAPDEWPALLEDLSSAHLSRRPYRLSKRTVAYDFDIHVITPFARAAEYVQEEGGAKPTLSFEDVFKRFDPGRLTLQLKTVHRTQDAAEGVLLVLKTDTGTLQPYQDKILSSMPEKIGQYFERFHVVVRDFNFDSSQVAGTKSLTAVLIENDDTTLELPIDLEKLR
jgi:hypothetical protein